jgi:hypothetical protein
LPYVLYILLDKNWLSPLAVFLVASLDVSTMAPIIASSNTKPHKTK